MTSPLEELGYPLAFAVEASADGRDGPRLEFPDPELGQSHRTRVRSLGGMQKEALVTSSLSGTTWRLASDEGEYLQGDDVAPAPLAHLTTGMVSAFVSEVLALARARDITIHDIEFVQDNYYTMSGSALRGTMTGGALPVELRADVDADVDDDTTRELVTDAITASPVFGLLDGAHESAFRLVLDGQETPVGSVGQLEGPALSDPAGTFEAIPRDADERQPPVIHRTGRETDPLPEGDESYTSGEGSSLAADQDRVLHLRGTCTLRDNGEKHVEVEVFSPIGTVFEFRSDEPEGYGGQGRAPDAMTYVAAGIGFCFMTQMGRYADIVDADLSGYRIVQDTQFSTGAAGGDHEGRGRMKPVETHAFLETAEGADFARELLEMSEQTCFLHALASTDLGAPDVEFAE